MTAPRIPPSQKACANCRYWQSTPPHHLSYPLGECRASHPSDWRETKPDDWCGVFDFPEPKRAD